MAPAPSRSFCFSAFAEAIEAVNKKPEYTVDVYTAGTKGSLAFFPTQTFTGGPDVKALGEATAGRWGMRLFEGDRDIDMACELNTGLMKDDDDLVSFSGMIHQTDMMAPPKVREFYKSEEYKLELAAMVEKARRRLDTGIGARLFIKWRAREQEKDSNGLYRVIILGALFMRAGAKIRKSDRQHLRELVDKIPSRPGYTIPVDDTGFRDPGKAQFLAALDNYKAGTPRSFGDPSCYKCGKMGCDIGYQLDRCGGCRFVWYCNQECQKAHWPDHKEACARRRKRYLNV